MYIGVTIARERMSGGSCYNGAARRICARGGRQAVERGKSCLSLLLDAGRAGMTFKLTFRVRFQYEISPYEVAGRTLPMSGNAGLRPRCLRLQSFVESDRILV